MGYFKDEHGVECLHEEEFDNLFIKNKQGRVFLVNKTEDYAKKHKLRVVYKTTDGKIIITPSVRQTRRVNRQIKKAREIERFLNQLRWNGYLKILARSSDGDGSKSTTERNAVCPTCGERKKDGQKTQA